MNISVLRYSVSTIRVRYMVHVLITLEFYVTRAYELSLWPFIHIWRLTTLISVLIIFIILWFSVECIIVECFISFFIPLLDLSLVLRLASFQMYDELPVNNILLDLDIMGNMKYVGNIRTISVVSALDWMKSICMYQYLLLYFILGNNDSGLFW